MNSRMMRVLSLLLISTVEVTQGLHIMKGNDDPLRTRLDAALKQSPDPTLDALYFSVEQPWMTAVRDPNMEPHMRDDERQLLYSLLEQATTYQEFGTGGSTVVALHHKNIQHIHSVESAMEWIDILSKRDDISAARKQNRLNLVYGNIGPTGAWGTPTNRSLSYLWPNYSGKYAESTLDFDLVFVDGRFRVACLLKALRRATAHRRQNTVFAMHDYMNRRQYHVVEEFLDRVTHATTLTVFRTKEKVNNAALDAKIIEFEKNFA